MSDSAESERHHKLGGKTESGGAIQTRQGKESHPAYTPAQHLLQETRCEDEVQSSRNEEERQPIHTSDENYHSTERQRLPGQRSQDLSVTSTETCVSDMQQSHEEGRQPNSPQQRISAGPTTRDICNSSNVMGAMGNQRRKGCISEEGLTWRIKDLSQVFVEVQTQEDGKDLLEKYNHVTICGAPGDGKTSIALMVCHAYRTKGYETLFVDNIEDFDTDTFLKPPNNLLIVFDDIFGSVSFSCDTDKLYKVFSFLTVLLKVEREKNLNDIKRSKKLLMKDKRTESPNHKLRVMFTSRKYNFSEGCSQLFQFKFNLFRSQTVIDLTQGNLTFHEKTKIMSSFEKWTEMGPFSSQNIKDIVNLQNSTFGFPFICKLFFTTSAFQIHGINFFKSPLNYLRTDLDCLVREGSNRSAAVLLLILCEGCVDLIDLQTGSTTDQNIETMVWKVKEIIPSCTKTAIGKEINNFNGTYCTVEHNKATFSHPSIYDAAACSFGKLNMPLMLQHCKLRFLFERVRTNKSRPVQLPEPDDVTNMIYIDESLFPFMVSKLVTGIKQKHFNGTLNHPILKNNVFASMMLSALEKDLPSIVCERDVEKKQSFMFWVSLSKSFKLFEKSLELTADNIPRNVKLVTNNFSEGTLFKPALKSLAYVYEALVCCVQSGKLEYFQNIIAQLNQMNKLNINFTTKENESLLMLASQASTVDILKYLVRNEADANMRDQQGRSCLHLACALGGVEATQVIIDAFPDLISCCDDIGRTPAMVCAEMGHKKLLRLLVSKGGVDLRCTDYNNKNCLHLASLAGHDTVVRYLLSLKDEGLHVDIVGFLEQTAVMMAVENGHSDVFNLLVSEGADLSLTDLYNADCLMLASQGGNVSIVRHLLSLELFDINRKGGALMQTPILMAVWEGHSDVFSLLVSEGADLSLTDADNANCLMLACQGGNVSIVGHLLSLKMFDINKKGGYRKQSPLMTAAKEGNFYVFNLLASEGADLTQTDEDLMDCLMLACEGGNNSIVKHLLSLKMFDINRKGGFLMQTSVMMAAEKGHIDVFSLLVSQGADLSQTLVVNKDCLILACEGGNVSIVRHLLSLKMFDINRKGGFFMQTPVMVAANKGHAGVFSLLALAGAELSLTDKYKTNCLLLACQGGNVFIVRHLLSLKTFHINRRGGHRKLSPVMMAAKKGHSDVFSLLALGGANLSKTDKDKKDCLMLACEGGNVSIVRHLLSLKMFAINKKGGFCMQTPVMFAAKEGHLGVFNLLVVEGADLSLTDAYNRDCLMLACEGGNISIVKHLLSLNMFDIDRKDGYSKQSSVMMATEKGYSVVFSLLTLEGADLSLTDEGHRDCLMLACEGGNVSIVRHLLSLKMFDINRKGGSWNQSPVMMAAWEGHSDVVSLLLSEGADLSLTDENKRDCLMLACQGGNVSIVRHLLSMKMFDINRKGGLYMQTPVMMAADGGHSDVFSLLVFEGADLSLTGEDDADCLMLACQGRKVSIVRHLLSLKMFDINKKGGVLNMTPLETSRFCPAIYNLLLSEAALD